MGGGDHCYFSVAIATVDVFSVSNNDVKLVDTRTVRFA